MENNKLEKEVLNVLIVDDEPGIRRVLKIYLQDLGYKVQTATDGQTASQMIDSQVFDLVLTDIRMPGMDGIELLKYIKKKQPNTQVIMITGHGDFKLAIKSLKLDAVDFISKPIDNDSFDIALKRAWDKIETQKQIESYTLDLERRVREKTRELDASRKKYVQLFNESPNYLTVQTKDLLIVEKNRSFEENFDYMEAKHCYQVYKGRDSACPNCPVLKTFSDGKSHVTEMDVVLKNNRQRNILIKTSAITDADGRITHVMEMSTDVTMIRKLQDHLASLGLHISSVSHGLKQALTGLDGGAYLLESGLKKKDMPLIDEGWQIVKDKISTTRKLVLDILFHSKKREVDKKDVSLLDLINEIVLAIQSKADLADVTLDVEKPGADIILNIDKMAIFSAFVSILENAVEACEIREDDGLIRFSTELKESAIVFRIKDNGRGIKADCQDKIFDLFYSQKGNKGTGLGLFIASRSIKQHGGTIQVNSKENQFTEFIISLPVISDSTLRG